MTGATSAEISANVEAGVRGGQLPPGAALPPVRILARQLGISPATVAKAYQALRQRGILEADGRRGTRVRARPAVAAARSALRLPPPPGALDLSAGEPDLRLLPSPAPHLRALAGQATAPVGYADAGVLPELADAARDRLAADGVPVDGAAVTVTGGALDAIERLLTAHLRPGDAVAVEDPGWANLFDLLAALGLRTVPVAVDGEGPEPAALAAALKAGVRAVIITVRAQNPTGAALTAARAAVLRELLGGRPGVLLIEDDHAAELATEPPHCLGPVTGAWAFVRSASKPFGPDLRIAVLAGDETTVSRVVGRMRTGMGWVSTLSQRLLLRLWSDAEVTGRVAAAAASYARRRHALRDALTARGLTASGSTGINVWVRVPDETRAVAALRDAGYAVAPGSLFRVTSPPGIRITVSTLDDDDIPVLAAAVAAAVRPEPLSVPMR